MPLTNKTRGGGEGERVHAVEFAYAWDDPLEVIAMKGKGAFTTRPCCSSGRTPVRP